MYLKSQLSRENKDIKAIKCQLIIESVFLACCQNSDLSNVTLSNVTFIWNYYVLLHWARKFPRVYGIILSHIFIFQTKTFIIKFKSRKFANNVGISLILTAMLMTAPSHMIVQWEMSSAGLGYFI